MTPAATRDLTRHCLDAEAAADLPAALRLRTSPAAEDHDALLDLRELSAQQRHHGTVPGWMWARWITRLAYRWLLFRCDPRVEKVGWATAGALYPWCEAHLPEWPDEQEQRDFRLALTSWVAREVAVFDYGGLDWFLDRHASPRLAALGEDITLWSQARMSGFRLQEGYDGWLRVDDLSNQTSYDVLDLGLADEVAPEQHLIGRLVPILEDPGWAFTSRPVAVDARTAHDVASTVRGAVDVLWLTSLWLAVREARVSPGVAFHTEYLMGSDARSDRSLLQRRTAGGPPQWV